MATIVKTLLKSAMHKDKDKPKKKDKDKARSAFMSVGPTHPSKPPSDDPSRAPGWVDNAPPLVDATALPRFADLRQTAHDPSARDKVGPWIQAHAVYTVDPCGHPFEYPEAQTTFPSRVNSPAVTVLPQESISVIGVGRGVPRGHQTMQSFSALQETPREPAPARPLSDVMSRGAPVYDPRAATNSPATRAATRSPVTPRAVSRSGNPEATPQPHLHQPKPEHPFNYAKAQEARDREMELVAERAAAEVEQRRVALIAAREEAQEAEKFARLAYQRQAEELEYRQRLDQYGQEDSAARRELDQDWVQKDEKIQAEMREVRERRDAYDAAYARLHAPLTAGNRQDKHDLKWEHVFSAADMRPHDKRDTFSTESFGHKFHADGRPIPAPLTRASPSPKPAAEIQERAAHCQTVSNDAKIVKRSSKPKRKEKHHHALSHSPAELLQNMEITRNLTLVKTINEYEFDESDSEADAVSQITRLTNIAKLVDDSTFHDDTLCQLLDAARLNLIGDQAKRVLMRAARTRVDELSRELLEREAGRGNATPPLVIRKKLRKNAAVASPLPAPVTPVAGTAPPPAQQLSTQPTANASPSPSKNEEAITELLRRMTTLMEAFEASKNRPDIDGSSRFPPGGVPPGGGPFPPFQPPQPQPPQMYPMQVMVPEMIPQGGFQTFQPMQPQPVFQPPSEPYTKFEEQPYPDSMVTPRVGPNGYIPTGGHADEYMMAASIHSSPTKAEQRDAPSTAPSPTPSAQATPKAAPREVPQSDKSQASKAPTEASRAQTQASKVSKAATQASKAHTQASRAPTQRSRALSQAASAAPSSVRTPTGPIINIFSPTTVQGDPTQSRAVSNVPSTPTQEQASAPPPAATTRSVQSRSAPPETPPSPRSQTPAQAVVLERDLPPLPESVASHLTRTTAKPASSKPPTTVARSRVVSRAATAVTNSTPGPDYESGGKTTVVTRIVVRDGISPSNEKVRPWDIVVGRLHAMAAVWQEDSFVRAMSSISLKREVGIVPLTIYTMTIYKSYLRNRLTALKPLPCDKLVVSPVHAETINSYIFAKKYNEAAAILASLWAPLSKEAPRVIITMTKHGYQEGWLAHRWDLTTGHLTSHHCVHVESRIDPYDKRPFNWWHAIRAAFPERGILEPRHLLERNVRHVYTAGPSDNSLRAALVTRNLLNGNKGDVDHGLSHLRDTMWKMTQQLLRKKQAGELMAGPDEA